MTSWDTSDPFANAREASGALEVDFNGEIIPLLLRYHDVRRAALDHESFSSDAPFRVPIPSEEDVRKVRQLPIEVDPPEHTDYRAIVQPFFARPRQPDMIERVGVLVDELLGEAASRDSVEVVREFALPLQSRALTLLLGMPMSEAREWIGWGTHVFRDGDDDTPGSRLADYIDRQLDRAAAEPGDDFFSALSRASYRGRALTRDEMAGFANLAFAGGRDTVINILGFAMAWLAEHPGGLARLRETPALVRSAVEEFVRVASPLTHIGRVCPHGIATNGVAVEASHRVSLCWASANRDASIFEAPNEVRIDRQRNAHLGFGAGAHMCLGAPQARLVLRTVIEQIAAKGLEPRILHSEAQYEEWPGYRRQIGFLRLDMEFNEV